MKYYYQYLHYVSVFSVFLPLILGLVAFKRLDDNSRVLVVLLVFAALAQVSSFYPRTSVVFYNLYTVLDSIFWGYLFYRNSHLKQIKILILLTIFLQPVISLSLFMSVGISEKFFSELVCLNNLLLSLWVLSFFYERYLTEDIQALEKEPLFWFCLGILVYAPTSYFFFAFPEVVRNRSNPMYLTLRSIHDFLNSCEYFIFAIGIYINVFRIVKFKNAFN